jgi:hypothetical protein
MIRSRQAVTSPPRISWLVPLCRSQREQIEALRQWLRDGRAQSASYQETRLAEEHFVKLQIN